MKPTNQERDHYFQRQATIELDGARNLVPFRSASPARAAKANAAIGYHVRAARRYNWLSIRSRKEVTP